VRASTTLGESRSHRSTMSPSARVGLPYRSSPSSTCAAAASSLAHPEADLGVRGEGRCRGSPSHSRRSCRSRPPGSSACGRRAARSRQSHGRRLSSVSTLDDWPPAPVLRTERLSLEPLRVDHAEEMAPLLDDPQLYVFTGGSPRTLQELRSRYEQQVTVWSVDGCKRWLNWIVRDRSSGQAVGGVQATVTVDGDAFAGQLAWIIGARHQRRGFAREAAVAMAAWLREQGAGPHRRHPPRARGLHDRRPRPGAHSFRPDRRGWRHSLDRMTTLRHVEPAPLRAPPPARPPPSAHSPSGFVLRAGERRPAGWSTARPADADCRPRRRQPSVRTPSTFPDRATRRAAWTARGGSRADLRAAAAHPGRAVKCTAVRLAFARP